MRFPFFAINAGVSLGSSLGYPSVSNFASLPVFSEHNGETFLVQNSSGIWPFNFKQKGLYRSDGASWNYLGVEYDTTSLKVGTEVVTNSPVELTATGLANLTPDANNGKINIDASLPSQQHSIIALMTLNNI